MKTTVVGAYFLPHQYTLQCTGESPGLACWVKAENIAAGLEYGTETTWPDYIVHVGFGLGISGSQRNACFSAYHLRRNAKSPYISENVRNNQEPNLAKANSLKQILSQPGEQSNRSKFPVWNCR